MRRLYFNELVEDMYGDEEEYLRATNVSCEEIRG